MVMAAIYARVSSTRQTQEDTIASQTAAIRAFAEQQGLEVGDGWVFEDQGVSGATLVRPALERLRDLVVQMPVEVVLVHSPDRLARRYAYQALLIEEFARAGTEVRFVKAPAGDTPEDRLLVQFQGMIAEYERAQIAERTRRGKLHRARCGSINVLGGAPYGYRYVKKTDSADARYEIVEHQAVVVREIFARYVNDDESIAGLCRWLESQGIPTATGKRRWHRSTVWAMLRNTAYVGRAGFGKSATNHDIRPQPSRSARLAGNSRSTNPVIVNRDPDQWILIPVPALVDETTFERAARRLEDNKRFAARNSTSPAPLKGLVACRTCSYALYRTSTTTTSKRKIVYYRCIGSDGWRHEGGKQCDTRPIRADELETAVWEHVTRLLADPALIRAELEQRLTQLRATNPVTAQRAGLERDLARTTTATARLLEAYQEQLLELDELRARIPELRKRETTIRAQLDALDAQLVDQETYLKLAENLDSFLARLRESIDEANETDRQRVLRAVVRDILISPDTITIRHSIPTSGGNNGGNNNSGGNNSGGNPPSPDPPPAPTPDCLLRTRSLEDAAHATGHPRPGGYAGSLVGSPSAPAGAAGRTVAGASRTPSRASAHPRRVHERSVRPAADRPSRGRRGLAGRRRLAAAPDRRRRDGPAAEPPEVRPPSQPTLLDRAPNDRSCPLRAAAVGHGAAKGRCGVRNRTATTVWIRRMVQRGGCGARNRTPSTGWVRRIPRRPPASPGAPRRSRHPPASPGGSRTARTGLGAGGHAARTPKRIDSLSAISHAASQPRSRTRAGRGGDARGDRRAGKREPAAGPATRRSVDAGVEWGGPSAGGHRSGRADAPGRRRAGSGTARRGAAHPPALRPHHRPR